MDKVDAFAAWFAPFNDWLAQFIHWPLVLFVVLVALGYNHFVTNPQVLPVLRHHRFALIDFLLYAFAVGLLLSYIMISFRSPTEQRASIVLGIASALSLAAALILIIWQDVHLTQPHGVTFHRSIASRIVLTLYVVGVPLFVFVHMAIVVPQRYLASLALYRQLYSVDQPDYVSREPNSRLRDLYDSLSAIDLHLLRTKALSLPPEVAAKDVAAQRVVNNLNREASSFPLSLARFLFYLLSLYIVLRYAGLRIEVVQAQHKRHKRSLGLEEDVISKVSTAGAGIISLSVALVLSGFSFGEIGVFSGLVAAGVSVALRDVLANLLAGVILTWDRTISKDDVITLPASASNDVGSTYGIVKAMTLRYTEVEERNTVSRLIPNSLLINNTVENWTKSGDLVRLAVNVGVDYKADPKRVKAILEAICYEVDRISMEKRPQVLITALRDSAVNYSLRFWAKNPKDGIRPIMSAVYFHILERLGEEGIDISFPQLDLHIKTYPPEVKNVRSRKRVATKDGGALSHGLGS